MTIADREVLVTGATRGIGKALVEEALRRRAKRVYAGTRQPLAHPDRRVTPVSLDVTNAAQIQAAVERVESLDLLINNAGVAVFDDLSDRAALEPHLADNLSGVYGVTHENGEEEISPDPMSQTMAQGSRSGVAKAFERQNAALLEPITS
jgi:NAD(P)-dependent dehydrogenase (short-subunit alcohol dehydrogenase family)